METESQIEGQMKNQIRHLQEDDIDAVAKIWLDTNMEAHSFVPAEYWKENLTSVKGMFFPTVHIKGIMHLEYCLSTSTSFHIGKNQSAPPGEAPLPFLIEENSV